MITVYISIGNSDDKLTQAEWAAFLIDTHKALADATKDFHGSWFSHPGAPWQNACWCIEIADGVASKLKDALRRVAANYRQDSIAWAEAPTTEFLS